MEGRLKVSDFSRGVASIIIPIANLNSAVLTSRFFVAGLQNGKLCFYSLPDHNLLQSLPGPNFPLLAGAELGDRLCLCFQGDSGVWVYEHGKLTELHSHLAPVTSLLDVQGQLYSSSEDLTVRIWSDGEKGLIPDGRRHILSGHSGRINCLQKYDGFVLSGGEEGQLLIWKDAQLRSKMLFEAGIRAIEVCQESQLLAVLDQEGSLSLVELAGVRAGKGKILKRLWGFGEMRGLTQVNDCFLETWGGSQWKMVQINFCEVMAEGGWGTENVRENNVVAILCFGRMTLWAARKVGLCLLRF